MYKSCSKCGKIHDSNYKCKVGYQKKELSEERKLRNKKVWARKSKDIRERANYLCEVCRAEGIYNYRDIEVHHITKIRDNKDKLLDDTNLICLCKSHHKLADLGKIDKDYLLQIVKERK